MSIDLNTSVGDLVSEQIGRLEVFEAFGIDYCCGGKKSLLDACLAAGVASDKVSAALAQKDADIEAAKTVDTRDWREASLRALTDHIVETHHAFTKRELPRVGDLLAKVLSAHGGNHPELAEVSEIYYALRRELEFHMMKEEQVLFPMIQEMESGREAGNFHCGSLSNPIDVMEQEHDNAGAALRRLSELTDQYTPPADGCATYQGLMAGLSALERDLHEHIHKENNILHPRAMELEASLIASAQQRS